MSMEHVEMLKICILIKNAKPHISWLRYVQNVLVLKARESKLWSTSNTENANIGIIWNIFLKQDYT